MFAESRQSRRVLWQWIGAGLIVTVSVIAVFMRQSATSGPHPDAVHTLPDLNNDVLGDYPVPAQTLAALVASSDLVVIGNVTSVDYIGEILPENWDEVKAEAIAAGQPGEHWASGGVPVSHVEFTITSYVYGSPAGAERIGPDTILLQHLGDLTRENGIPDGARRLYEGKEVLLFIGWNGYSAVDGRPTYGIVDRALGVFTRNGDGSVSYADPGGTRVPYVQDSTFNEVLARVRQLASK